MRGLADSRHAPGKRHIYTHTTQVTRSTITLAYGAVEPAVTLDTSANSAGGSAETERPDTTPPDQPARPTAASRHELMRYKKIERRLRWKWQFLELGYRQAVSRDLGAVGAEEAALRREAELMFKLDFFEYYMLVERALVHLQGVFGITISRDFAPSANRAGPYSSRNNKSSLAASRHCNANGNSGSNSNGTNGRYAHRYHANVLDALDAPENPLHETLGWGEVRHQLARAKDLRNRWKTADNTHESVIGDAGDTGAGIGGTKAAAAGGGDLRPGAEPLEAYDLERILTAIFSGLRLASAVAEAFVRSGDSDALDMDMADDAMALDGDGAGEAEQWEFMVDAMDWEAV